MRRLTAVIGFTLVATALSLHGHAQRAGGAVMFEGARLLVGDGSVIETSTIVIEQGRFTRVGREGEVQAPAGATRVDLHGKTVMPAMVNPHLHLGYEGYTSWSGDNYTRDNVIDHLNRQAYYGVGAVLSTGTDPTSMALEMQQEQQAGKFGGARFLYAAGAAPPNGGPNGDFLKIITSGGRQAVYPLSNEADARQTVQLLAGRGIKFFKIWVDDRNGAQPKLPPNVYRAFINEAHKFNAKVLAHPQNDRDMKELLQAGIDALLHVRPGPALDLEAVAMMKARNVWVTPTLGLPEMRRQNISADPVLAETLPPMVIKRLGDAFAKRNPPAPAGAAAAGRDRAMRGAFSTLLAADVWILPGTDAGGLPDHFFGYADHKEIEVFVSMGMTPAQAITSATKRSAAVLGLDDMGAVAVGKSADFIVLDANPLADIRNTQRISKVYLRGGEIDRAALRAKWAGSK